MIWSILLGLLGATVLSGAVLGAALGLTGFAILHFWRRRHPAGRAGGVQCAR